MGLSTRGSVENAEFELHASVERGPVWSTTGHAAPKPETLHAPTSYTLNLPS